MEEQKKDTKFKKGHKGGPGRPKGARNKLAESFLRDLNDEWDANGVTAIRMAFADNPMKVLELIASLLPKEATLNVNETLTLKSEPISKLDEFLKEAIGSGEVGKDQKLITH